MNKFKMTGIAMLLSLGVSGSVVAQDGFVKFGTINGYSAVLKSFIVAAQSKFEQAGGLCGMMRSSPVDSKKKPLFTYDPVALVPPGYAIKGQWEAPCSPSAYAK